VALAECGDPGGWACAPLPRHHGEPLSPFERRARRV